EDAAAARKAKKVPFAGAIDPMKNITDTSLPEYIRKRGTALDISSPMVEIKPLTHVEAAKKLAALMGAAWKGQEHFAWLKREYPTGVKEEEIESIAARLRAD